MAPRIYPSSPAGATNSSGHRLGQDVDIIDQLSSVTLLGLAIAGSVTALVLVWLIIG